MKPIDTRSALWKALREYRYLSVLYKDNGMPNLSKLNRMYAKEMIVCLRNLTY